VKTYRLMNKNYSINNYLSNKDFFSNSYNLMKLKINKMAHHNIINNNLSFFKNSWVFNNNKIIKKMILLNSKKIIKIRIKINRINFKMEISFNRVKDLQTTFKIIHITTLMAVFLQIFQLINQFNRNQLQITQKTLYFYWLLLDSLYF
jgi:hypothetical protein